MVRHLEERLRAVGSIGHVLAAGVGVKSLLRDLVPHISQLMRAKRTTLFLYDETTQEIWSQVAEGEFDRQIRLKLGHGLAGWVALHRQPVCIKDAYTDPRFNQHIDQMTGFRTESVVAVPIIGRGNSLVGVLQSLNHEAGCFGDDELSLMESIAQEAAYAVENARLTERLLAQNVELRHARERAERHSAELDLLFELEQEIAAAFALPTLLDSVLSRACGWLRSASGSLLLTTRSGSDTLYGWDGQRGLRLLPGERDEGVLRWVADHREPALINDPSRDVRLHPDFADRLGFTPRAYLAVPLVWDQQIIGAVAVLDPQPRLDDVATSANAGGYDVEDHKMLTLIAGQLGRAIQLTRDRDAQRDGDRLVVIGRMMASVAHDLRNPMTAIAFQARLMVDEAAPAQRARRCDLVALQIDEMTAMISDVLAFARGDSTVRRGPIDLMALAAELTDALTPSCAPHGIALSITATPGIVHVDGARTKRILYNLTKNAIDELRPGGRLTVTLTADPRGLTLRVDDNGPGIPAELKSRIFEPFVASGKAHGTGLGLSIVKRFVEDQNGHISVDSTLGQGTTFIITLPSTGSGGTNQ